MQNLEKYVSELLMTHECVIIPEFGAFLAQYQASFIKDGVIYPPSRQVAFNSGLSTDDQLLVNFIAVKESISNLEALKFVEISVSEWKNILGNSRKLTFEFDSVIYKKENGEICFETGSNNFLLPEYSGFYPMEIVPVNRKISRLEQSKESRRRLVWRYSLAGSLPIIVLFLSWFLFQPKINLNLSGFLPSDVTIQMPVKKVIPIVKEEKTMVEVKDKLQVVKPKPVDTDATVYYIIGGSFKNQQNAEDFRKMLLEKNYYSEMLTSETGNFRVSYNRFLTETEAHNFLNKITSEENSQAWILKVKNN